MLPEIEIYHASADMVLGDHGLARGAPLNIILRFLIGYDMRMNHCWQFKRSEQEDDSDLSSEDVNTNRIY
jgi:hypothetical protein